EIFRRPTIKELARYITDAVKEDHVSIEAVEEKEYYPLSPAQKRLYLIHRMDGRSTSYNITGTVILKGDINDKRLEDVFRQLICRHESLRTSFETIAGEPVQRVHRHLEFRICRGVPPWSPLNGNHSGVPNNPGSHRGLPLQYFIRPFDLSMPPLLRVHLIKLEDREHILAVDMHHIISDGISVQLCIKEFMMIYDGKPLPPLKIRYKDYSRWRNDQLQSAMVKAQEDYWLHVMAGELPVLELPTDFPRPAVKESQGNRLEFDIEPGTLEQLRQLSRETGTTYFMVLLTIFNLLLSRLGGQEDIVVGTPTSGRAHGDLENVIGMFINTLCLRNYPTGEKQFSEFLMQVKSNCLQAFENQDYQYEDLVDAVVTDRDLSRNPLFDTMLSLQNMDRHQLEIPGLELVPYDYEVSTSKFDLTLTVVEDAGTFGFSITYGTMLFKRETIERFINYFKRLTAAVLEDSHQQLSRFDLLSEQEKQQLLINFNCTQRDYPANKTIHQLFEEQVERTPDRIASTSGDISITYYQLNKESRRLARLMQTKGIETGAIVAIMAERSVETITGILGILKAGAAYLPIDPGYPKERIDYMLKDTGANVLVNWLDGSSEPINQRKKTNEPATLAYILYTSGTTGNPKGVVIEHRSVINLVFGLKEEFFNYDTPVNVSLISPFVFDASVKQVFPTLLLGHTLSIVPEEARLDSEKLVTFYKKKDIRISDGTPAHLNILMTVKEQLCQNLPVELFVIGGEELKPALCANFTAAVFKKNFKIVNVYGPTECCDVTTLYTVTGESLKRQRLPIGKPLGNIKVYILSTGGILQPIGVSGELCIGGAGTGRGYLNRPDLTLTKFAANPFEEGEKLYRSGDLTRWLTDGNIEFLGRIDHQVKIRGYRIELGEIQAQLEAHQDITGAAVVVTGKEKEEHSICAYVVSFQKPEAAGLRRYLAKKLPDYMIPSYFVMIERIPLTPNGKLDRRALPEPVAKASDDHIAPQTPLQRQLSELWSGILVLEQPVIGINDNFFQLGGNSLKATFLVAKINKELNAKVPLSEVFQSPTIRELAEYIAGAAGDEYLYRSIEPAENKEYYVLSSAQKRLYVLQRMDPRSTAYNIPWLLELNGETDTSRLQTTFKKLIDRHESLRTSIEVIHDEAVQIIHKDVRFELEHFNRGLEARDVVTDFANNFIRPFDLSCAPLLRVGLLSLEDRRSLLMMDLHHIISDAVSRDIVTRDFIALYSGAVLPDLVIHYKDYALWQTREEEKEKRRHQEDFWKKTLAGERPVLDLPTDYTRPAVPGFEGRRIRFNLEAHQTAGLKKLAFEGGLTLYMVLLAVYNILLSKLSGKEDIIIGTPIAGRRHSDFDRIMGMFVNTLALRNFPRAGYTFQSFLKEVKTNTLDAFENQDYPFEDLVEQVELERDTSRNPLFDTMFALQNVDVKALEIPGLKLTPVEYDTGISKFDLGLSAIESGETLSFSFEYSTKLFTGDTIQRFTHYLKEVISTVTGNDGVKLSGIDILPEEEKRKILVEFNDTAVEYPLNKTVHRLFREQAERIPGHVSLAGQCTNHNSQITDQYDAFVTFAELDEKADRLAHYLYKEKGVRTGQPVAVLMERSMELIIALIGIMKAGGAYVPLDPSLPPDRLRVIFNDASVGVVISQEKFTPKLTPLKSQCDSFHSLYSMDTPPIDGPHGPGSIINEPPAAGHPAYVMYTSGSSGAPKGVLVEHRTIVNTLIWRKSYYDFQPGDVSLRNPPYFFDSSVADIFTPLLGGARLVLVPEEKKTDLTVLEQVIPLHNVSHFVAVPAFYNLLVEEIPHALAHVKHICVAGEHFPDQLIRKHYETLPHVRISNEYGPTENSVSATIYELKPGSLKALIGKPISNVRVYILDPHLYLSPIGVAGEICLAGSSLACGYLNNPELTTEKFIFSSEKFLGVQTPFFKKGFGRRRPPGR
ncbi:MAG: amino acid adenylation domain-containing protein, partial [bacterium]|nr:amino acid adenylation domain-containing protein [bacterium]